MAFLRKRANGMNSLSFWRKGKSYIKALASADELVANEIKKDAEEQLAREDAGDSAEATELTDCS